MNEKCDDCTKKECVGCKYQKDRFKIERICDAKCIFDNMTEEMYCENDLEQICLLLNQLNKEGMND